MRKQFLLIAVLALFAVAVGACGGGEAPAAAPQAVELKVASAIPEGDINSQAMKFWGDQVTQRTGGRITFKYFWAGSLLNIAQMFDGTADGRTDVGTPATSYVSGKIPDLAVLEVPFTFPLDAKNLLKFQDEVNPIIDKLFQERGVKLVWSNPAITADPITCRDKFLSSPQQWKGALVRTAGRWQAETLKAWGARAETLPIGELYTALQRRTVDCTLLVYNLLDSFKIYEVAKNITRIDHSINYATVAVDLDLWKKLSAKDQKTMLDVGEEARKKAIELRQNEVERVIKKFKDLGVKICTPSPAELKRLRDATDAVWDTIRKESGYTQSGAQIMAVAQKYRGAVAVGPTEGEVTSCPAG